MTAELKPIRTAAETGLVEAFAALRRAAAGHRQLRRGARRRSAASRRRGLPHRRIEEWKYTDLRALMRDAKPLAVPPDAAAIARARTAGAMLAGIDVRRIVFVDGLLRAGAVRSRAGAGALRLPRCATRSAADNPAVLARLGTGPAEGDIAYALNTAFMGDGAVIAVAQGRASGAAAASRLHVMVRIARPPCSRARS